MLRRPSAFAIAAAALATTAIVGHLLWFAGTDVDAVAFVIATGIALGLGWASHASTVWSAAARAALAAWGILVGWIAILLLLSPLFPVDITFSDLWQTDRDEADWSISSWLLVQFIPFSVLVAACSAPFGAVAWAYGALPRERALRLLPAAVVLAPVGFWVFVAWDEGPLSFMLTLAACGWLVWALRRSRTARAAAAAGGSPGGSDRRSDPTAEEPVIAGR
ncbi:MAG: hypothetical protein Q7T55_03850 [Solirubrobacteraceae bacterium]|nr:hypothetical protein [Solirubrobacteraceae bacterium]